MVCLSKRKPTSLVRIDALFNENMALVYAIVARIMPRGESEERDDCVQAGLMALHRACCGFDPARGFKFSTYAYPSVWRAVKEERHRHWRNHRREMLISETKFTEPWAVPDDGLQIAELSDQLAAAMQQLAPKDRAVVYFRYVCAPALTLKQVGERLGVSRERIRQFEVRAIAKLRGLLVGSDLDDLN